MSIILKFFALGGFLYYWQIRRPETYLKESRRSRTRIGIEITKWLIILGAVAIVYYTQEFIFNMIEF